MKVLVTGAAGFIGSHCSERLKYLGHDVLGVDNFSPHYDVALKRMNEKALVNQGITVINIDLNNPDLPNLLPADVDYIFHFAAQPGISSTSTFQDYLENNFLATKSLLDAALKMSKLKLFVNIGTSSIYGLEATYSEEKEPRPASFYGVTKLAGEQMVLQYKRENKMKACSLRLYSVIGPRERPEKMFTKLIDCGISGKSFPLFEGSDKHLRSFTYVSDIVDGVVSVIGKEDIVNGEIINIGTEKEYTTKEGIEAVEKVLGRKIALKVSPKRPGDQFRTKANIEKAKRLLGYNPETTLLEAVKKQVQWYKTSILPSK